MQSLLKEHIRLFLIEALNIPEEDIFIDETLLSQNHLEVVYDIKNLSLEMNRWRETEKTVILFIHNQIFEFDIKSDEALQHLKEDVKNVVFSCPEFAQQKMEQLKALELCVSFLKERVERLREKKRELKYTPGNRGALEAQKHFEEIQ
ncbi:hypothetical protein B1750_gp426 [Noumeavirus]|uniref:hypothetical protein n=1 Tax=Noumeavirus TaxID=1955558 RepID=UPI000982F948|nr:hypothetical protein B1750_gp426 [Noumeavirus]AQM73407.1 hypothetical protein NMV_426 [Noumeavirus]